MSLLCMLVSTFASAQRYALQNYNTENGLVQSQALTIAQDPQNRLWIGTFGGASVFDGSEFKTYTRSDGLIGNTITAIGFAQNGISWIGTTEGLCSFDGLHFKQYKLTTQTENNFITDVKIDNRNRVWVLSGNKLYLYNGTGFDLIPTEGVITTLCLDDQRYVYVCYLQKGIYKYINDQWVSQLSTIPEGFALAAYFAKHDKTLYVLTTKGLYRVADQKLNAINTQLPQFAVTTLATKMVVDANDNIWIAVGNGLWLYHNGKKEFIKLHSANGYTDEQTLYLFIDNTNNVWFGTNGSGIFKYSDSPFKIFDNSQIPFSKSIINIFQRGSGLILSTGYHGIYQFDEQTNQIRTMSLPDFTTSIISIHDDLNLGTYYATYKGLWNVDNGKIKKIKTAGIPFITDWASINNEVWCITTEGLSRIVSDSIQPVHVDPAYRRMLKYDNNNIILGTKNGVIRYNIVQHEVDSIKGLEHIRVQCLAGDADRLYIGTDDNGIMVYDYHTKKTYAINHDEGLSCNYTYNLLIDKDGKLWVGTGCGIDRITFAQKGGYQLKSYGKSEGLAGAESNERASYQDASGNIWFGTTKGLYMYNKSKERTLYATPFVTLNNVQLFSRNIPQGKYSDSTIPYAKIPYKPVFEHDQNNLTFSYRAISLSSPEKILYRYKLEGADPGFIETNQTSVVYTSLPPGYYTFIIYASDENGNWSENAYKYSFTIKAIFYQTTIFKAIATLLLAALLFYAIYWYSNKKEARRQWELKLREEEQNKVRQRTAEDFHDEIGNKITRINLLTMMAERKVNGQTEVADILIQIRNNTQSLYHGSKDIIWSLQKESNYLKEALLRIQQNAYAILEDTGIKLHIEEEPPIKADIKMPLDYSRNMILIFKEAINNAVKYAGAQNIYLRFFEDLDNSIVLELSDDGIGYALDEIQKGNGLKNIQNRAAAIKAKLSMSSEKGQGTTIRLRMFTYSFKK
ncbi:two-component regulator propeller domain-containing protein [Taibaiella sp. KBW10]|uniref:ligand-binding sensor domain-containing protein n=1 Tax=Taibaiella sp. KBW10 TaxID=2153357 RepID=UPI001F20C075|nr:sensor histidine kinase [Taibaiella sp. KBW10]